jgi:hypothetical protein
MKRTLLRLRGKATALFTGALVGVSLMASGTAHADDDSFLAYLDSRGYTGVIRHPIRVTFQLPQNKIAAGHHLCNALRVGTSPEDYRKAEAWAVEPDQYAIMLDAAQHELCPDTVH